MLYARSPEQTRKPRAILPAVQAARRLAQRGVDMSMQVLALNSRIVHRLKVLTMEPKIRCRLRGPSVPYYA